jgi:hypothetical protein
MDRSSIYLSIYLSIYIYIYLFSIYIRDNQPINLPTHQSTNLSTHQSTNLHTHKLNLPINQSTYRPIHPSIHSISCKEPKCLAPNPNTAPDPPPANQPFAPSSEHIHSSEDDGHPDSGQLSVLIVCIPIHKTTQTADTHCAFTKATETPRFSPDDNTAHCNQKQ